MKMSTHNPLYPPVDINLGVLSSEAFRAYLLQHQLSYLRVAQASGIHQVSVWNIANGVQVLFEHAEAVRIGLQRLTGESYSTFIYSLPPQPNSDRGRERKHRRLNPF